MSEFHLDDSGGEHARLFPLPNLVFFPRVVQPLHIFEPRYRQMTADALDSDRRFSLVLPRSGWQKEYAGNPSVHSIACQGRIIAEQKLEDGRYNLLLKGEERIRILEEVPHGKLYRLARVEVLHEVPLMEPALEGEFRERLVLTAPKALPLPGQVMDEFRKLLESDLPMGQLVDVIAFALPLDFEFKQQLLEEVDVEQRTRHLIAHLEGKSARTFPPRFSAN